MHMKDIKVKIDRYDMSNGYELREEDFYPPEDCRVYSSSLDDIDGGDCFADYAEYFWAAYENHVFDCNN